MLTPPFHYLRIRERFQQSLDLPYVQAKPFEAHYADRHVQLSSFPVHRQTRIIFHPRAPFRPEVRVEPHPTKALEVQPNGIKNKHAIIGL